jgi:CheY-like chemotaxis protein
VLSRTGNLSPEVAEGVEVIERNARSQAQMIEDLLDVSRVISGKIRLDLQDTHLPSIIDLAVETVRLTATTKGVRIEKLIDPLVGVQTTGDPGRLQQIVWNLLTNAVKFTPRGGKVQVVLERVDSHVELSVSDTGQGISPDFLPHVFDRFRQADSSMSRRHGGLGLGLSIVRNLVELHGGNVRAHSPGEGQGATFVISLPMRVVHRPEGETHTHPRAQSRPVDCEALNLKGVHVLVIDDEPDARQLVARILEECECVVQCAVSIEDALNALDREPFDLLISDIGMPGGDGFELIRRWRELEAKLGRHKTPAVALTAYARAEDRRRVILAGFQAHIAKPVESGELLALVASLSGRV